MEGVLGLPALILFAALFCLLVLVIDQSLENMRLR